MTSNKDHTDVSLGAELLAQIFALLPATDLICAEACCTHWHQLIRSHNLWQRLTEKTWVKHHKEWWAAGTDWNATSQQAWKSIYISMLATWRILPMQKTVVRYLTGHTQAVTCLTASSHTIASGSADKKVRLWDRRRGTCKHVLHLPSPVSAIHLLSDDLIVVTCVSSCSIWKGSRCLRNICPNLFAPCQGNCSHICASAVSDNLLFLVVHGTASIQVWDLYSGLELRRFRPVQAGASSAEDHHITALVAGTVHGHQILLVGVGNAALKAEVLVLHQDDGQSAAPPIPLNSDGQVSRIVVHEDGIALATIVHATAHTMAVPVRIHLSEAQDLRTDGRPAFTARSTSMPTLCGNSHGVHNLAATHFERIPILAVIQRRDAPPHPMWLNLALLTEQGLCEKAWCKHLRAATKSSRLHSSIPTSMQAMLCERKNSVAVHSCGLLLTTASGYRVAVWQFPSSP